MSNSKGHEVPGDAVRELTNFLMPAVIGFFAIIVKFIMHPPQSFIAGLRGVICAVFVSLLIVSLGEAYELNTHVIGVCCGIGSMLGDYIVQGLFRLGYRFSKEPSKLLKDLAGVVRK